MSKEKTALEDALSIIENAKSGLGSRRDSSHNEELWDKHIYAIQSMRAMINKMNKPYGYLFVKLNQFLTPEQRFPTFETHPDEEFIELFTIPQPSGFTVNIDEMKEAGKTVYAVALYHPSRAKDAAPWDKGRIDLYRTEILERAEFIKDDWEKFLSFI